MQGASTLQDQFEHDRTYVLHFIYHRLSFCYHYSLNFIEFLCSIRPYNNRGTLIFSTTKYKNNFALQNIYQLFWCFSMSFMLIYFVNYFIKYTVNNDSHHLSDVHLQLYRRSVPFMFNISLQLMEGLNFVFMRYCYF